MRSLIERFLADTPVFFKKIHVFGLLLVGLAVSLSGAHIIPEKFVVITGTIGGTLALVSQFAVKDTAAITGAFTDPASLIKTLPDLFSQVAEIKNIVSNPPPVATLEATLTASAQPAPDQPKTT